MNSSTTDALVAGVSGPSLRQDASVIGMVGLAHASSHFSQLLLPLMFPVFIKEFSLTYSEMGLLVTVFFVVSGLGQAGAGFVVDRFGARPVLFASLGTFVLACLLAASANSYAALMAVAVLTGLGNSPFHPVDFTILNKRVSPPRLGHAYSAHGLSGNLGWALAPVFLVGISAYSDWRTAYLAAALLYGAVLLLMVLQRDHLRTDSMLVAGPSRRETRTSGGLAFMRLPVVWWCFAFFMLSTMAFAVVQSFGPSLLKEMHGISFELASMMLTAYMLFGAVGILLGGFVAAHSTRSDHVVAISLGLAALLLALCGTGLFGAVGTMVALALTGMAVGVGGPSRDMMIRKATPPGATGRVYGLVYCGLDVGLAISPLLFGLFMDRGWYGATFFGAALTTLLGVYAALGVGSRSRAPG